MRIDFGSVVRRARESPPTDIAEFLAEAVADLGGTDLVVYLVDFGQSMLEPLPDRSTHAELPTTEAVATTMAGRAFTEQRVITAERDDGFRVWAPILEGSDRTGVVALNIPGLDGTRLAACEELGLMTGYLLAALARYTDVYNLFRRRKSMTLAASMQWDMLPPLVLRAGAVSVAGLIEPAYEVGGDCFDYAANGPVFDFAIIDAMGHGVRSAVIASLTMGAYRHGRRESRSLASIHTSLASTLEEHYEDSSFATGLLGRIETATGTLTWTNAGHCPPLLVRGGQVIGELNCDPTPPWGLFEAEPKLATESLEPGDSLLLYTDGVTGARSPDGEELGVDRLADLTQRYATDLLGPEEIVRRLVASVMEHQSADLTDDATVVMVRWDGPGMA